MKISPWVCLLTNLTLCACYNSDVSSTVESVESSGHPLQHHLEIKNKLTDLAGKATMPKAQEIQVKTLLIDEAQPFIGRYQVEIDCHDPFVDCQQGVANFIITLLPDGTARRSIVYMGKIMFASNQRYQQDQWFYDQADHQIILRRSNGVEFFYDIDEQHNLIMNLDKIAHANKINKQFFSNENPLPELSYVLKKTAGNS